MPKRTVEQSQAEPVLFCFVFLPRLRSSKTLYHPNGGTIKILREARTALRENPSMQNGREGKGVLFGIHERQSIQKIMEALNEQANKQTSKAKTSLSYTREK